MPKKDASEGNLEDFEAKVNELADEIDAIEIDDAGSLEVISKCHEKYLEYFAKDRVDAIKKASKQQGWSVFSVAGKMSALEAVPLMALNKKLVEYAKNADLSEDQKKEMLKNPIPAGKIKKLQGFKLQQKLRQLPLKQPLQQEQQQQKQQQQQQ